VLPARRLARRRADDTRLIESSSSPENLPGFQANGASPRACSPFIGGHLMRFSPLSSFVLGALTLTVLGCSNDTTRQRQEEATPPSATLTTPGTRTGTGSDLRTGTTTGTGADAGTATGTLGTGTGTTDTTTGTLEANRGTGTTGLGVDPNVTGSGADKAATGRTTGATGRGLGAGPTGGGGSGGAGGAGGARPH
jgi:hypothetical protein